MQRAEEGMLLAKYFEQFAALDLECKSEEEFKNLLTTIKDILTKIEENKPSKLSAADANNLTRLYFQYGHLLEKESAINAYHAAFEYLNLACMPRDFNWYLFAARIHYSQGRAAVDAGLTDLTESFFYKC